MRRTEIDRDKMRKLFGIVQNASKSFKIGLSLLKSYTHININDSLIKHTREVRKNAQVRGVYRNAEGITQKRTWGVHRNTYTSSHVIYTYTYKFIKRWCPTKNKVPV